MIKFIQGEIEKENYPTYSEVKQNQFFVSFNGELCQKYLNDQAIIITDCTGKPDCSIYFLSGSSKIKQILPTIKKIEF